MTLTSLDCSLGPQPIQKRWAFLVGIDVYTEPSCQRLKFCVNDVTALAQLLIEVGYTVVCLYDEHPEARRRPTRSNVKAELKQLCEQVEKDDLVFVHFACHGVLSEGLPILMMQDSRSSLLTDAGERLTVPEVESMLRGSRAKRLVLSLDACHMGVNMGRAGVDPQFMKNVHDLAAGLVVMAGSTAQQLAQEWNDKQHGVYTYFLLEALSGRADRSGKNYVTVNDVHSHVVAGVKQWLVQNSGVIQEPTMRTEGFGDMILVDRRKTDDPVTGESPSLQFPDVANFDLQELIDNCLEEILSQQGLVGLAIGCSNDSFLNNFCERLKQEWGRSNTQIRHIRSLSARLTNVEREVAKIVQYQGSLVNNDVICPIRIDASNPTAAIAERFWADLQRSFTNTMPRRLIIVMFAEQDSLLPANLRPYPPPKFTNAHVFRWIRDMTTAIERQRSIAGWVDAGDLWREKTIELCCCEQPGLLDVSLVYYHLEFTFSLIQKNPLLTPQEFLGKLE